MRNLLVLIILAAGAYFGWKAWQEQPEWLVRLLPKQTPPAESEATPAPDESNAEGSTATVATPAPAPTPAPRKFISRINVPPAALGAEEGKLAPGNFLVIERASVETKDGVVAIIPGDQVRLIERHADGTLTVTNGQQDFVVKESQVTQDIATAEEAERKDFEKRFGRLQ
jgi:hypothetical protein